MSDKLKRDYSMLLVDDDQFLLDMYAMKFSECGCKVESTSDPEKAIGLLRDGMKPNIILLDIMMPGTDGFAFLKAIREEKLAEDSIIIMLTNQGQQEDIEKAMELGADGYIVKASAIPSEVLEKTISIADAKDKKK
jgi:DNA-binding response OmpR family regulator